MRLALELLAAGALAGCQQPQPYMAARGPQVKPGHILIPVDQVHHHAGRRVPSSEADPRGRAATEAAAVQIQSEVSAIQFNRYADPARPAELMHEAHLVYRRDTGPRWRLRPSSADQQILIGPTATDDRGEIQPLQSQELEAFVREQRTNVKRQQELVVSLAEGMQRLAAQQEQLARELAALRTDPTVQGAESLEEDGSDLPPNETAPFSAGRR